MSDFTLTIHNSYCAISQGIPQHIEQTVEKILTYQNDIKAEEANIFYRMKMLKKFGVKKKKTETSEDARARAKKQMKDYQDQLKALKDSEWVCWYQNRQFPTGLKNIVCDVLDAVKANYTINDQRIKPKPYAILPWNNKPFEPRYYQKEAIDLSLSEGRGVVESAVGTGKSLMMAYVIKELSVNTLVVVPSRGLLQQIYNDFTIWFGSSAVQMVDSQKVRRGDSLQPIRIITIQSLAALQKSGDLGLLIGDVDAMFLDEFHHAGSSSYTNLLPEIGHIYHRFGFTGTFLRNDNKILDLWGFLSTKLYSYPAWKAIKEGYLTPLTVITHNLAGKRKMKYQKEYDENYCGNQDLLEEVRSICTNYQTEQILILVNKKDKSGKIIHEYLNALGIANSYISGDDDKQVITDTISDFNDLKIRIMVGSTVISEGIDVRSTDHLINCQGGKSPINVVQSTGRAVRLFKGKTMAYRHDFNFIGTKFLSKHFASTIETLKRNFEPKIL
jgi:superfamily II DNA or RNA helicase